MRKPHPGRGVVWPQADRLPVGSDRLVVASRERQHARMQILRKRVARAARDHLAGALRRLFHLVALLQHAGEIEAGIIEIRRQREHPPQQPLGLARAFGFLGHACEHAQCIDIPRARLQRTAQQRLALAKTPGTLVCGGLEQHLPVRLFREILLQQGIGLGALALRE